MSVTSSVLVDGFVEVLLSREKLTVKVPVLKHFCFYLFLPRCFFLPCSAVGEPLEAKWCWYLFLCMGMCSCDKAGRLEMRRDPIFILQKKCFIEYFLCVTCFGSC